MPRKNQREAFHQCMEELRALFGGKCNHCGTTARRLEFAHLQPTAVNGRGRGSWQRYYDIRRYSHHYILLCVECHSVFDAKEEQG